MIFEIQELTFLYSAIFSDAAFVWMIYFLNYAIPEYIFLYFLMLMIPTWMRLLELQFDRLRLSVTILLVSRISITVRLVLRLSATVRLVVCMSVTVRSVSRMSLCSVCLSTCVHPLEWFRGIWFSVITGVDQTLYSHQYFQHCLLFIGPYGILIKGNYIMFDKSQ